MQDEPKYGLPSSAHVELATLGACLVDAVALEDATAKLTPADFHVDAHRRIFAAILATAKEGLAVEITTVCETLRRRRELDAVGGPAYIAFLSEGLPRNLNIESYVRIVKNASLARQGIAEFGNSSSILNEGGDDARKALEGARDRLNVLIEDHEDPDLHHVSEYFKRQPNFDAIYERMATTKGIHTAIAGFNLMTMGYQPRRFSVIAARPGVGKTAKMVCDAYHAAVVERKTTAIFTLEDEENDIMRRMLSQASKVPFGDIKAGSLTQWQRDALMDAQERIMDAPLYITDSPGMTASRIRSKCARQKREKEGLDAVFIDQLSQLKYGDVYRKGMPKHEIIGEQTNIFVLMAQELETAVVLLCQLRRYEGKGEARPSLELLKDSGDIEEDAFLVTLLHRPRYHNRLSADADELIVAKHREGETGTIECNYNGSTMSWQESTDQPQQSSFGDAY